MWSQMNTLSVMTPSPPAAPTRSAAYRAALSSSRHQTVPARATRPANKAQDAERVAATPSTTTTAMTTHTFGRTWRSLITRSGTATTRNVPNIVRTSTTGAVSVTNPQFLGGAMYWDQNGQNRTLATTRTISQIPIVRSASAIPPRRDAPRRSQQPQLHRRRCRNAPRTRHRNRTEHPAAQYDEHHGHRRASDTGARDPDGTEVEQRHLQRHCHHVRVEVGEGQVPGRILVDRAWIRRDVAQK